MPVPELRMAIAVIDAEIDKANIMFYLTIAYDTDVETLNKAEPVSLDVICQRLQRGPVRRIGKLNSSELEDEWMSRKLHVAFIGFWKNKHFGVISRTDIIFLFLIFFTIFWVNKIWLLQKSIKNKDIFTAQKAKSSVPFLSSNVYIDLKCMKPKKNVETAAVSIRNFSQWTRIIFQNYRCT